MYRLGDFLIVTLAFFKPFYLLTSSDICTSQTKCKTIKKVIYGYQEFQKTLQALPCYHCHRTQATHCETMGHFYESNSEGTKMECIIPCVYNCA